MPMRIPTLYNHPIWLTAVVFLVFLLFALEVGYWLGCWWRRRTPEKERTGSGDIALTAMFGLLGLVLAFTYAFAIGHTDNRKRAVVAEANALGTAFLRAGLASEPYRSELRRLLRDYAAARVFGADNVGNEKARNATLARSLQASSALWPTTERMAQYEERTQIAVSIVQSINEVIDMHSTRNFEGFDLLPETVLYTLLFVAGITLGVSGYNRGLVGDLHRSRMTAVAIVPATVMTTITDFDRGYRGWVRINQSSLEELIQDMDAILATGDGATLPATDP
jgi:hypothetical protein